MASGDPPYPSGQVSIAAKGPFGVGTSLSNTGALYPSSNPNTYAVLAGEIVFRAKSEGILSRSTPLVRSALNGLGMNISKAFPRDMEMQREVLFNSIVPLGTSYYTIQLDESARTVDNQHKQLSVQIAGLRGDLRATYKTQPGDFLEYCIKSANEQEASRPGAISSGVDPSKHVLGLRPVNPQNSATVIINHVRRIIQDENSWLAAMNPASTNTKLISRLALDLFSFATLSGIMFSETIGAEFVKEAFTRGQEAGREGREVDPEDVSNEFKQRLLLVAFRSNLLAQEVRGEVRKVTDSTSSLGLSDSAWLGLYRTFLGKVFYDGETIELGYGATFDATTKKTKSSAYDRDGQLMRETLVGNMIHQQINVAIRVLTSLTSVQYMQQQRIAGKVAEVKGPGVYYH